jgi:hypothetical protein
MSVFEPDAPAQITDRRELRQGRTGAVSFGLPASSAALTSD